jgi:hypothetical protein
MADNTTTIQSFLNVFATPIAAGNVTTAINTVTALFSPDGTGTPLTPSVGIGASTQDPQGPAFRGNAGITALFTELLSSFPGLTFVPYPTSTPVFCVAQYDPNTIIIQAQLITGSHVARWFPPDAPAKRRYYSKPLSDLVPAGQNEAGQNENLHKSTVPICAVFTFDPANTIATNQHTILNLGMYLDRWKFATDLWVHGHHPFPHP